MKIRLILVGIVIAAISCKEYKNEKEHEYFIAIENNKIHVKQAGKGLPIIFAHGGYLDLEMWDPQVNEFSRTNQLILFSDLGHGETVSSGRPIYGYKLINELTKKNLDRKFDLVGLSWGAMLCVDFALNYPEKVNRLILISPGLSGWSYFRDSLTLKNYDLRQEAILRNDTVEAAKLFHQNWVIGPKRSQRDLDKSFQTKSMEIISRNMRNHWLESWSNLDTIKAIERLERIHHQTYIIIGDQDALDIKLIAEEYNKRLKNSKKIVVPNVAHLINMEDPNRFNKILLDILKK